MQVSADHRKTYIVLDSYHAKATEEEMLQLYVRRPDASRPQAAVTMGGGLDVRGSKPAVSALVEQTGGRVGGDGGGGGHGTGADSSRLRTQFRRDETLPMILIWSLGSVIKVT